MPERMASLFARMGEPTENFTLENATTWGRLRAGARFDKGEALFPRIDESELPKLLPEYYEMNSSAGKAAPADDPNLIGIDDFRKIDLRVAKIVAAERLAKTDKLLKLQIDIGGKPRQIVAGIAEHYQPEELIGKQIIVVANLEPVKLRGELSEGMLLAAKFNGKLTLLTPDGEIPSGSAIS